MPTKEAQKNEQYKNLEVFYETIWLKQSVTKHSQARKKCLNQQKQLRLPMSEIESHGVENKSKKETDETFFLNLIWNSLKQTAINWNIKLD